MQRRAHAYRWYGLAAGFTLSLIDFGFLLGSRDALGLDARAQALTAFALFALTFTILGFLVGWLIETRIRVTGDAAVIREQLAALEASQRRLVEYETLASIGRLAAGVAHEVRNPLAVIRSAASLLQERADTGDAETRRASEFICEEVDRLDGFVRALLDFSRPPALTRRATDLQALLERARMLAGPALAELETREAVAIAVELELENSAPREFELDPDVLAPALSGLLVNAGEALADIDEVDAEDEAEDATPPGGRVRLTARAHHDALELVVADDGPGVDDELRARLFDPFVTTRARGTGLGLPMAARAFRAHGGDLQLRARAGLGPDGRGACFVATIPRSTAERRALHPVQKDIQTPAPTRLEETR